MAELNQGDALPELQVTPDDGLTKRYADASGDPNPIHTDEEFAKSVGLPGCILHGLWTMAQVAARQHRGRRRRPARAEAPRGPVPRHGLPRAGGHRHRHRQGGRRRRLVVDTVAEQSGNQIIRNAEAELKLADTAMSGRRRVR